jgi:Zinc carboxypeptidase/Chitobiase/beta-hexosaminidase C-terminal domain
MIVKARRRALVVASACVFAWLAVAGASASELRRGIDPNQGQSLVEVDLPSKAAAMRLQLRAERYGVEFNEHYLRRNANGSVTATVFGTERTLARLHRAGYDLGTTIEGPATWEARIAQYRRGRRAERRARAAALNNPLTTASHEDEIVILRADYFENYAGRFLSVEAKDRLGGSTPEGATYTGPTLSLSWDTGPGTPISTPPRPMSVNIDPDTTPDTYIEHRLLVRIGDVNTLDPRRPSRIRVGSSTGAIAEAGVDTWLGGGLPPMGSNFLNDFTTHYMDPTEVYGRIRALAAEFPNIARLVPLPYETNGYQRRAQATMAGELPPGNEIDEIDLVTQSRAVVLTSRSWGHEGGNDITAEFRNPGLPNGNLDVTVSGNNVVVELATDAAGAPSSTAAEVAREINTDRRASRLIVASTYRGNAGAGIVEPRVRTPLSDFLTTATNAHVARGPFQYHVLRIGNRSGGPQRDKVGVFLYCQQHAREWATPLTCLETAEQLLRNYAIHPLTRRLVNNLDIFILPSSNPDGAHYSMHNFNFQRRNLTNHCVVGGKETDNPNAQNFWRPRINPGTGQPYTDTDPGARDSWGVDLNRNNTAGTVFDGYIGASHSCTSDVYTGPAEASEPEIKNELWIADTFDNIKFSNNIHSYGGYFMWSPGAYLPDRSEGDLVHPNIGVEKYFFEAGDRILNRIKEHRNTVILPERTGPIADVLYSAGGNSADEHWYNRDVIAYSFETGADRYGTTLSEVAAAGSTGIRVPNRNSFRVGDRVVFEPGTANEEVRFVASIVNPQNPPPPAPNVILTEPLAFDHAAGSAVASDTVQTGVGFQPDYATEGKHEALEFAAGNYGLLESALDYAQDVQPPQVQMTGPYQSSTQIDTTFEFVNEPSVIRYTTDGSRPTKRSRMWDSTGPREPGEVFHLTRTTTFRWLAEDIKGNLSRGSERFVITPSQ